MKPIASPSRTRDILQQHGLQAKKSLGQNFMVDANILRHIISVAELDKQSGVIEIGPGLGALTELLAETARQVVAYEIDGCLIGVIRELLTGHHNVHVLHQDVLQADLQHDCTRYFSNVRDVSVVANLPYYITTPVLFHILESGLPFRHVVLLLQKEVAERLSAKPGSKAYNALTIAVQYYTDSDYVRTVPRTVFIPQPNVDSAVIKLSRREKPAVQVSDEPYFFQLIKRCFSQRRKTLWNNLTSHPLLQNEKETVRQVLLKTGIDGQRRAETLTIEEFAVLSNTLYKHIPSL